MQPRGQDRDAAQGSGTSLGHRASWDLATDGIQHYAVGSELLGSSHPQHPAPLQMSRLLQYCKHTFRAEPDPEERGLLETQELHAPPTSISGLLLAKGAAPEQQRAGFSPAWFPKRVQDAKTASTLEEL